MDKTTALEKIKKLLRLSNSDNEGEARQALQAAQRLMAKFHIEVAETEEISQDSVVSEEAEKTTKSEPSTRLELAALIGKNMRCKVLKSYKNGGSILFIGESIDVKIVKETFNFAWNAYLKLYDKYTQSIPDFSTASRSYKLAHRNSYFNGFLKGVAQAFEEVKAESKETALALIIPNSVQEFIEEQFPQLKKFRPTRAELGSMQGLKAAIQGATDGHFAMKNKQGVLV